MPFGAALSAHPVSSHATGEVIGQVLEAVGPAPDVAVLLATPGHAGALEDIARAVTRLLEPTVLVGGVGPALVGQGAGQPGRPGLALWAGATGPVEAFVLPDLPLVGEHSGALVLGDALPAASLDRLSRRFGERGGRWLAGGVIAGPLVVGERTLVGAAVGVAFRPQVGFEAVAARAWRPVGPVLAVTDADPQRCLVLALDGVPALTRLRQVAADEVPAEEIAAMNRRLGLGPDQMGVADVRGADRANGALATGPLPLGSSVRFWVRDHPAIGLRRALADRDRAGIGAALAFVAGAAERGYGPGEDHDAEILADTLAPAPVVGVQAQGQLAAIGGRARLLAGEASVALFPQP